MREIQECSTRGGWREVEIESASSPDVKHTVMLPPWRGDAVCDCEGFRYRGTCRHLAEAQVKVCTWSELDGQPQTAKQRKTKTCPDCGADTIKQYIHN